MTNEEDIIVQEEYMAALEPYIVVCRNDKKNFPLVYLQVTAASENDAFREIRRTMPGMEPIKAYPAK
jgi:hypothetical protein